MPNPVLTTRKLRIGYTRRGSDPRIVADHLDLSLHAGELACLIGPNGAGKSTLIRTLAGMQAALSGDIRLLGDALSELSRRDLAQRLSVVLTEKPDAGQMSGYALVALGRHPYTDWMGRLSAHDEAMVRWAVESVGANDIAERPVAELSDGQRQKIMIARALAQDPAVMVLDEPTAFLDLPRRVEMMRLLGGLAHQAGQAILVSTHDLDLALRTADSIWLMSAGGEMHVGTPEDLVLSGALERAFRAEGVVFDPVTGAFKVGAEQARTIRLQGDDSLAAIWTQRALERLGWRVIEDDSGDKSLIVVRVSSADDGAAAWAVVIAGTTTYCESIGAVVRALVGTII